MEPSALFGVLLMLVSCVRGFNINVDQASIISGTADSYFGYSVDMMVEQNKKAWVFVGAPLANDTGLPSVNRPGAIHKCDVIQNGQPQCEQLSIDNAVGDETIRFANKDRRLRHGKDGQWLGVHIDVPPIHSGKGIVTCSHRWYDRKFEEEVEPHYFMNGLCYEIPGDLTLANTLKYPAMVDGDNQTLTLSSGEIVENLGMASMGMAVHRSKKESKLLLGTPGLFDWTGGFVEISRGQAKLMRREESLINETTSNLYGSAITSGEYFGDGSVYYVLGGPRANLTGKVVLINGGNRIFSLALTDAEIKNDSLPVNANFGSALYTVDVNNDGLDDLLVGTPLYSPGATNDALDTADQGRVYLYLGTRRTGTQKPSFSDKVQVFSGNEIASARFGTAISGLGDINDDSFEDVVISAPYEDENRGTIYIYNGYKAGLYPKFSQRIAARRIGAGIMGFGISLSKPADLNWDGKSDFAVGAFLSDQAVVLYGQPVIKFNRRELLVQNTRNQRLSLVDRKSSDVFVYTGFQYIYSRCTYIELDVDIKLDVDKDLPRLESFYTNQSTLHLRLKVFNADYRKNQKEIGHVRVRSGISDLVSPIKLEATYHVTNMNCPGTVIKPTINAFNGNKPEDPLMLMTSVLHFKKDCPDNKCETDLQLDHQTQYHNNKDYFTSGTPFLDLNIKITKDGHPSYGSNFIIIIPKFLRFRKYEQTKGDSLVSCSPIEHQSDDDDGAASDGEAHLEQDEIDVIIRANETGQVCSFGNPLYKNSGVEFLWRIEVPAEVTIRSMAFQMEVRTQSLELNPPDNYRTVPVQLRYEVAAGTSGRANPEEVFVSQSWSGNKPTEHLYELENNGPSLLTSGTFDIHIPQYQHGGHAQLFIDKLESSCPFPCAMDCSFTNLGKTPPVRLFENGRPINAETWNNTDVPSYDAINNLDCSEEDCAVFHCAIANLTAGRSAVISVNFNLSNELKRLTKDDVIVTFTSTAEVQLDSSKMITNASHLVEKLSTSLIPPKPKKGVAWWIIVASAAGGIALIAPIIFFLYKIGFFKRKRVCPSPRGEIKKMDKNKHMEEEVAMLNPEKQPAEIDAEKTSYTDSAEGVLKKKQPPTCEVNVEVNEKEEFMMFSPEKKPAEDETDKISYKDSGDGMFNKDQPPADTEIPL